MFKLVSINLFKELHGYQQSYGIVFITNMPSVNNSFIKMLDIN